MKKIKLLLIVATLLCAITALCVCANAATYSGTCGASGSNLTWTLDTDTGVLEIDGTGGMKNWSLSSFVPWHSYRSSIKTVTLGDNVASIGGEAFNSCGSLISVEIPASVISIGERAFLGCNALTSIIVDEANTYYSSDEYGVLFNNDKTTLIQYPAGNSRTSYTVPNSVTSIYDFAFFSCSSLTSLEMPSVASIGESAFNSCRSLTNVEMPSVTSIGESAFQGCEALISVEIPASVTSISDETFLGCDSLASITVDEANTYYSSDEYGVLFNKDKTTLIQYSIGNSRTSYTVPSSVTSIYDHAFWYCATLTSVEMPSVTSIGKQAFRYCRSLTSVSMPSVTSIGEYAFASCTSLTSLEIPASVTSTGRYAFSSCHNLKKATICTRTTTFGTNVFSGTHTDFKIHGYTGSTAETYANENDHPFVALDAILYGDADMDGEITIRDAAMILQYLAAWNVNINLDAAEVDGNGKVGIRDAALILQYLAGWDVELG